VIGAEKDGECPGLAGDPIPAQFGKHEEVKIAESQLISTGSAN
jgi:hypothetical protein